jgi:hypothetical protein
MPPKAAKAAHLTTLPLTGAYCATPRTPALLGKCAPPGEAGARGELFGEKKWGLTSPPMKGAAKTTPVQAFQKAAYYFFLATFFFGAAFFTAFFTAFLAGAFFATGFFMLKNPPSYLIDVYYTGQFSTYQGLRPRFTKKFSTFSQQPRHKL